MIPKVVQALGVGKDNAITRSALACRLGMTDRQMRRCIELARQQGWLIMNDCDGAGYYLAANLDLDTLERHYRVERSRAIKTLYRLKDTRRTLKAAGRRV